MRAVPHGIYTPLPCFFQENEDLDLQAFASHVKFVAEAGTIPVVSGSMGEAVHLSHEERKQVIGTARAALDEAKLHDMPIIAGVGAPSTRETIKLAHDAADAGADFVMVVPPGYYAGVLKANMAAVKQYFIDVAEASPVPVILYNFPSVTAGIDIDSDLIVDVVKASSNVCGVKLTCASVGKLTRITAQVLSPEFKSKYPRKHEGLSFAAIDGFVDFLLPSMAVGAAGAVSGLPNIAPKACVKLWKLCQSLETVEQRTQAQELQNVISLADGVALKIGIAGMKRLLNRQFGYNILPRRPLLPMAEEEAKGIYCDMHMDNLLKLERSL